MVLRTELPLSSLGALPARNRVVNPRDSLPRRSHQPVADKVDQILFLKKEADNTFRQAPAADSHGLDSLCHPGPVLLGCGLIPNGLFRVRHYYVPACYTGLRLNLFMCQRLRFGLSGTDLRAASMVCCFSSSVSGATELFRTVI